MSAFFKALSSYQYLVAAVLLLAGGFFYVSHLQDELAASRRAERVATQNLNAAIASTVRVEDQYQRLIQQRELVVSELQRELDQRPVIYQEIEVQAPVETSEEPVEVEGDSVFLYQFDVAIVKIEAPIPLPEPPKVTIIPEPLVLTVSLACSESGPVVSARSHRDDPIMVGEVSAVDPNVCNPVAPRGNSRLSFLVGAAAGAASILGLVLIS